MTGIFRKKNEKKLIFYLKLDRKENIKRANLKTENLILYLLQVLRKKKLEENALGSKNCH